MRMPLLAIAVLLSCGAAALADDLPQPDAAPAPTGPAKIIDTGPAPAVPAPAAGSAGKSDQAQPAMPPAPPPVSTQAKSKEAAQPSDSNRFSFVRVDDGFLRFDLSTGHVAYCNARTDGWGCQAVPENRSALEREVDSLKGEIAALKKQVEALREPPPPRPPAPIPPAPPAQGDITRDTPSGHDDIARAKAMLQDVWDRLVAAIVGIKNDVMRKS